MPNPVNFIQVLTRKDNNPAKDVIKVKKLAFIFNYFELEMQQN